MRSIQIRRSTPCSTRGLALSIPKRAARSTIGYKSSSVATCGGVVTDDCLPVAALLDGNEGIANHNEPRIAAAHGLSPQFVGRPRLLTWLRRGIAAAFLALGVRLALAERS